MIKRVLSWGELGVELILLTLCEALSQTPLGDYTGYTRAGRVISVHAGPSSVRITFYAADIVRVDFLPALTSVPDSSFVVVQDTTELVGVSIEETDSTLAMNSAALRVLCTKHPVRFSYCDGAGRPLVREPALGGLAAQGAARIANFLISPSEHFYGTGERGIGLDLRGWAFDSYNTQVYGYSSGLSTMNINIPFLASTNGYAIYFDNTYPGKFDLGVTDADRMSYRAAGGELTLYIMAAATVPEQLERYSWLTGRQPLPPRWALGYIQSKFGYQNETEARTMVATMRQKQIPCDAIILDAYWFDRMGDVAWYTAHFPNPFPMMTDFLGAGFKTVVITETYIINSSMNWSEAAAGNYLTMDTSGHSYMMPNWWACNCPVSLVDITKPAARSWWWSKHPAFFGDKLAGIWTDLGEPERHPADMIHDQGSTAKVHNIYNLLWAQAIFEGFSHFRPNQRLFNLTRSGFAGIQRYGVIPWSGDVSKTFGGLAVQLPMLLNTGMSGLAYHNSDIGGFCCATTTAELYVRWMEYGAFCPITRAHGAGPAVGGQDTEPWVFGPTAEGIAKSYLQLRYRLLPYIYTLAHENAMSGMPLARPLFFDYPDENIYDESSTYLWGNAFLVSPVVQAGQTSKNVYLPEGTWVDFWTDKEFGGGGYVLVPAPLETLPLFVRAGSIVPMQPVMNYTNERPLDTLFLAVYPSLDRTAQFTLYEDDGSTLDYRSGKLARTQLEASLSSTPSDTTIRLSIGPSVGDYDGKPTRRVYLTDIHGVAGGPSAVLRNGAPVPERHSYGELRQNPDGYFYDSVSRRLYIHTPTLPDSAYQLEADHVALVTAQEPDALPREFRLEQNYPNPFNPATVIRYSIPVRSHVVLKIYDILGRLMTTLVDGAKEPGNYEVRCDAAAIGISAGGVYLYRLEAGSFSASRKLVLIR